MKLRPTCVLSLAVLTGLAMPTLLVSSPQAMAAAATEDVLVMNDGRELRGKIISETSTEIVFELINRKSNLKTKLTLQKDSIATITRDLPLPESAAKPAEPASTAANKAKAVPASETAPSGDGSVQPARIYVVPMIGQMGTDIHPELYKLIKEDILKVQPDHIVIKLKAQDNEERFDQRIEEVDQGYDGSEALDSYREILDIFHKDLAHIKQSVWVEDSFGIGSVLALSWGNLYMMPSARFGGLQSSAGNFMHAKDDANKFGKFREAYMAWLKGFAEYGKYDLVIVDAMVRPEFELSASFSGRTVKWYGDKSGEYVIDNNTKATANFYARHAENILLSDGTAADLDDLAFLLGYVEYTPFLESAQDIRNKYHEDWDRQYEKSKTNFEDYRKFMGWAQGQDMVKYLGKAKQCLVDIRSVIIRCKPAAIRLGQEYGVNELALTVRIEQINEQLAALRRIENSGGGGQGSGTRPR